MRPAIRVSSLSKEFVLGEREPYFTLRETLQSLFRMRGRRAGDGGGAAKRLCALNDVSFEIAQGEVVGIIGHNGAGKSTLLKILSRITEPSQGEVELFGRVSSLLEVGTGFHPELTGRENIYLNGSILGMKWREINAKFDEIVAFSGVERFLDTPVKRYSSGMQVRLAFAVAAHLEPEILLVDEVLAVGDAEFQRKCLGKMGDVARSGRTVLFVSHNMAAIENLCSRGLLLTGGRLLHSGPICDTVSKYLQSATTARSRSLTFELQLARGSVTLREAFCANARGAPTGDFRTGDDVVLGARFTLHNTSHVRIKIAFLVFNSAGLLVFKCFSEQQVAKPIELYADSTIECAIRNARLAPGSYRVGLRLFAEEQPAALIEDAIQFHIEGADLYATGKMPRAPAGVFLPETSWKWGSSHVPHAFAE